MTKVFPLILIVLLLLFLYTKFSPAAKPEVKNSLAKKTMIQLTSSAFDNGEIVPKKYTCDGENINPPLTIKNLPVDAKSLVLIVDDPDAPLGTWNHWLVWNLDPKTAEIKENSIPEKAVQGTSSFEIQKYGGPCPHVGTHRYFFRIYALDIRLNLLPSTTRVGLDEAVNKHILDQGELMGKYSKQ